MKVQVQAILRDGVKAPLLCYAHLILDDWFAVSVKLIRLDSGKTFVAMPNSRDSKGAWHDTAFPITKEGRSAIHGAVWKAYEASGALAEV